jgi:hypothetical protein
LTCSLDPDDVSVDDNLSVVEIERRSWRAFRWALFVAAAALIAITALIIYAIYLALQVAGN